MSASPDRIRHLAALFRSVWGEAIGGAPSRGALQVALGVCGVEGWGQWSGEMAGSNNFGGDQVPASQGAAGNGVTYYGVEHQDQHLDGTVYTTYFRYYVDGNGRTAEENGAIDFLKVLALRKRRDGSAPVLAPLRAGDAAATAKAMHDSGYYEGFPPDPVLNYTAGIVKNATLAADALGEPLDVGGTDKKKIVALVAAGLAVAYAMGWLG